MKDKVQPLVNSVSKINRLYDELIKLQRKMLANALKVHVKKNQRKWCIRLFKSFKIILFFNIRGNDV